MAKMSLQVFFVFRDSYVIYIRYMDIMNVLPTGMNMSISVLHVWLCNKKDSSNLIWIIFIFYQCQHVLWNSRGISVHAFEFSSAENLSAQHMGWLGVRLKQVLTRVRASGWRCHSDVITVRHDTGWQGAGDVTHRKHAEVCVRIWRK